jgi:hypothetical protein
MSEPLAIDATRTVVDDMRLDAIAETMGLVGSYAVSGREAAWRDDRLELGRRVVQLRECLTVIIQTFNELKA